MEIPEANVKRLANVRTKNLSNVNVEATAFKLQEKLSDTHSLKFFEQVARSLPEHVIWSELEKALTKKKPAAYFSHVCKVMMANDLT